VTPPKAAECVQNENVHDIEKEWAYHSSDIDVPGQARPGIDPWRTSHGGTMSKTDHETTFDEFVAAVPSSIDRSHIEAAVNRYMASYCTRDVETRISLFAETLNFEDPIGHHLASTKGELKSFFERIVATGVSLRFIPERLVVVGDEALQIATLLIAHGGNDATLLLLYLHFVFGADGLITNVRVFYDSNCESKPI
jgi:hypothetical protein